MGTNTALSPPRTLEDFSRSLSRLIQLRRSSASVNADSQLEFGSKLADKTAVEALERLRYDGSSNDDDESKLTCIVCVEEAVIGSHLIRMPCSRMFHEDCILKWLNKSHTCPICRSKFVQ